MTGLVPSEGRRGTKQQAGKDDETHAPTGHHSNDSRWPQQSHLGPLGTSAKDAAALAYLFTARCHTDKTGPVLSAGRENRAASDRPFCRSGNPNSGQVSFLSQETFLSLQLRIHRRPY